MTNIKEKLAEYFEIEIATIRNLSEEYEVSAEMKHNCVSRALGAATLAMLILDKENEEEIERMFNNFKAKVYAIRG